MTEPSISEFLVAFADNRPDSVFTKAKAAKIEEQGWRVWLMTMFPFWFGESFSDEHAQYWELHWQIVHEIKRNLALPKEKRIPIAENRLVRLLLLGRGLGKCIDENTDISMADGTRCRIADVAIGDRIHAYDEERQRITTDVVTNKWHSGSKPCITVTTRTNKQITLTKEHRVLTFNGWRQAGELTVGDRIASPRRKPVEREEDADVYWDVIESITDAGVRNTYDIEVQSHHNFLANGLVTHNSATAEAARIMRGAILNRGYSLVISETDDQAQEHLGNARLLIEHPDSALTHYYPDMAIAADADALKGMPTADRKEMFITKSGYIFRAKGLTAKMRGLRVGVYRPDDILFDDIDDVLDSLAVSQSKLKLISASIIPIQAREGYTTIDFAQNVIAEHSVVNQIYTGKADALAERTVIGPAPAFRILDIDSYFDADGRHRHKILDTSQSSWDGLDIARAQKFLNDSGLEVFMAEYQNEFSQFRSGKVIPEFSEKAQFITWSDFEDMFGTRSIPAHWKRIAGLDVGYSEGTHPHWSAWNFIATAAENSPMPGTLFVYASRSFKGVSIDDQADRIKADLGAQEISLIRQWMMSHEKTGEMMTLRNKHQLPFGKFPFYRSDDGVAPWRHLSRCDQTAPHPFVDDEQFDGVWRLGRPNLFFIVDDEQLTRPVDDRGMRLLREQVSAWEYVPVKVTDSGQTAQKPSKINDDHCDCLKSCLALFGPKATVLTETEVKQRAMAETFRDVPIVDNKANVLMGQQLWSLKYDQKRKEKKRDPMKFR